MKKPNLFIVGAAKCGTTSLHSYLRQHPDVFMSPVKETGFFIDDLKSPNWIRVQTDYDRLFQGAGSALVVGDATPAYMYSSTAARRIHEFNPDARIVITLRQPVDMMYSFYNHLIYHGIETQTDFREAVVAGGPGNAAFSPALFNYKQRAMYFGQVKRFYDVFGPDRMKILIFETDLAENPASTFGDLCRFLEISDDFIPRFQKRNVARTSKSTALHRLTVTPPPLLRRLVKPVRHFALFQTLVEHLNKLNSKAAAHPKLNHELRMELTRDFHADISELGDLIQRDLSLWLK